MPTVEDQFIPDEKLLNEFLEGILNPKVRELDAEGFGINPIEIVIVEGGREKVQVSCVEKRSICKVAFYETFNTNRCVIKVSVRLIEKTENSGLCGFNLSGEIKLGEPSVKRFTLVYNELGFSKV